MKRNKPMSRGQGIRRTGGLKAKKPVNKIGPKTKAWNDVRRSLKAELVTLGATVCEFDFPNCWGMRNLSLAHAVKRRFLEVDAPEGAPENIRTVAVACIPCHQILDEQMSHEEMRDAVMAAIARRENR